MKSVTCATCEKPIKHIPANSKMIDPKFLTGDEPIHCIPCFIERENKKQNDFFERFDSRDKTNN